MADRIAVVLFNLGAPDKLSAVRPFLFNLFKDPAILTLPSFFRLPLAAFLSWRRKKTATEIYAHMGGASPLLPNTEAQAKALEIALNQSAKSPEKSGDHFGVFIAMRYWHPFAGETIERIKKFSATKIILLPLYPQFSAATTGSSFRDWQKMAQAKNLKVAQRAVCCWPENHGLIAAIAQATQEALRQVKPDQPPPRLLFSAHGLPKRAVEKGDPYALHVMRTAGAVMQRLNDPSLEWRVTYQSRVGPLEWLRPYTDDEIRDAGREHRPVVIAPIAFVSEHSETLVELDRDYRQLAKDSGVPQYIRVPTVGTAPLFIDGLAGLVRDILSRTRAGLGPEGTDFCPADCPQCPAIK